MYNMIYVTLSFDLKLSKCYTCMLLYNLFQIYSIVMLLFHLITPAQTLYVTFSLDHTCPNVICYFFTWSHLPKRYMLLFHLITPAQTLYVTFSLDHTCPNVLCYFFTWSHLPKRYMLLFHLITPVQTFYVTFSLDHTCPNVLCYFFTWSHLPKRSMFLVLEPSAMTLPHVQWDKHCHTDPQPYLRPPLL